MFYSAYQWNAYWSGQYQIKRAALVVPQPPVSYGGGGIVKYKHHFDRSLMDNVDRVLRRRKEEEEIVMIIAIAVTKRMIH